MLTVWKYALKDSSVVLDMPSGAKILLVCLQNRMVTIWAQVDTEAPLAKREFGIYGTGHEIQKPVCNHVGTIFDGPYVWHIYDHGEFIE